MPFSPDETQALLNTRLVGPTVVKRLEEAGIDCFEKLRNCSPEMVCDMVAHQLGTTCWKNSPQARQAIANAIATASQASE
jgi:hypothetical protein